MPEPEFVDPLAPKKRPRVTGARVPPADRKKIWKLHVDGYNIASIARQTGFDRRQVSAITKGLQNSEGKQWAAAREVEDQPDPRQRGELSPEAQRALDDFGYFRGRYFGRLATPWQEEAAYRVLELLEEPEKTFAVINAPPSSGKSSLFTHDIPCWLACRNRRLRALIGSRTYRQARWYTARLRRSFERYEVLPPDEEEVVAGRALTPEASLVGDFGRFRPLTRFGTDLWRAEEFVIAQVGDMTIGEKEASFAAYGFDSGYLGGRFRFVIWDDLVDRKNTRNAEQLDQLVEQFEDVAVTRLEMGGLLLLQGQRIAANDLYRHCLDQRADDLDDEDEQGEQGEPVPKYHRLTYKAHYDETCRGAETHGRDAPYWRPPATLPGEVLRGLFGYTPAPIGCLLDPRQITWRELRQIKANRRQKFAVLYQQEDVDPEDVLVPRLWIDGGTDPQTGELFPGCWDRGRFAGVPPQGLVAPVYSYVSVDPSPTQWWSCQHWLWHPPTEQLFLVDLVRRKMDAPEFLDWNHATAAFSGLAEEWQLRSVDLGVPITHWIVEANAAQRFLLQYEHVRRWTGMRRTTIVPHQTQRNRSDPEYGIQSLGPLFRHGLVRLPTGGSKHGDRSRIAAVALVDEVTRWPDSGTDDCVVPGTMVATPDGPRPVESIVPGDQVMTHKGRWRTVQAAGSRAETEGLFRLRSAGALPLEATARHPILVAPGRRGSTGRESFDLDAAEFVRAGKLVGSRRHCENPQAVLTPFDTAVVAPSDDRIDADFATMLGLYLAEGSCSDHAVSFALAGYGGYLADFISEQMFRHFGARRVDVPTDHRGLRVDFNTADGKRYFDVFGRRESKGLPAEALRWPPALQRAVLRGWLLGDGCFDSPDGVRGAIKAVSISRPLLWQMETFAARLGAPACLRPFSPPADKVIVGRPCRTRQSWELRFGEAANALVVDPTSSLDVARWPRTTFLPGRNMGTHVDLERGVVIRKLRHVDELPYNGLVHNLQVEEDESFVAEGIATHNCVLSMWMGVWNLPRLFSRLRVVPTPARRPSWMREGRARAG